MSIGRTIKCNTLIASTEFAVWCVFAIICGLVIALVPEVASAQSPQDLANSICEITTRLNGPFGKAAATLAVAAAGIMALYGRASWGMVFVICGGIALVFSAASVLETLNIGGATGCTTTATPQFSCDDPTPNLFAVDTITKQQTSGDNAAGTDLTSNTCVETANVQTGNCGIFSRAMWMFNNTIGTVMGTMYCGFTSTLKGPIAAALTLFVVVYGLMVLGGMAQFNLKDSAIMLFKFSLVWVFSTQAEWGVDVGYNFFINFAEQGSAIVIAAMPPAFGGTPVTITSPDTIVESILNSSTGTQTTMTPGVPCTVFLVLIAVYLILFQSTLISFLLLLIINYLGNFVRCILGYLTALVLISFLFILAPFFLGFALFRTTMPLFEAWLKHLIAFSLQMILMFGFMALLAMIPFALFFKELLALMHSYSETFSFGPSPFVVTFPLSFCGVCQYNIINAHMTNTVVNGIPQSTFSAATIQCVPHTLNFTGLTNAQQQALILNATQLASNATLGGQRGFMLSEDHNYYVMSILNLFQHSDFVKFVIIQAMSLYFISRVAGEFIKKAPELASAIGELPLAAALGGGATPGGIKINYPGMEAFEAAALGFKNGLSGLRINPIKNPKLALQRLNPANAAGAWKDALAAATVGRMEYETDKDGNYKLDKNGKRIGHRKKEGARYAFFHGAQQAGFDNQTRKLKLARGKKELDAAQARVDAYLVTGKEDKDFAKKLKKLQNAHTAAQVRFDKLDLEMRGYMKKGLFGDGRRGSSALNMTSHFHAQQGDETMEAIQRSRSRKINEDLFGRQLRDNESGFYGFMKIPEGVNRAENAPAKRSAAISEAMNMRYSIEARVNRSTTMSQADKDAFMQQLKNATSGLETEAQAKEAIATLTTINMNV